MFLQQVVLPPSSVTDYMPLVATGVSCLFSVVVGLTNWGVRSKVDLMNARIDTLRAEMKAAISEAELRIFDRINGSYAKNKVTDEIKEDLDRLTERVDGMNG